MSRPAPGDGELPPVGPEPEVSPGVDPGADTGPPERPRPLSPEPSQPAAPSIPEPPYGPEPAPATGAPPITASAPEPASLPEPGPPSGAGPPPGVSQLSGAEASGLPGPWGPDELVLRAAVCAFDDRTYLPEETHTVDALVSAMARRQWLSNEESDDLHTALTRLLPRLHGRPGRRRATTDTGRRVRRRPECVPMLLAALPTASTDPEPVLDELVEALTTPAGVRTDPAVLRAALQNLVGHHTPPAEALDARTSLEQFDLHLTRCVHAAHGRVIDLAARGTDPPAATLWALVDTLRDGAWLADDSLADLRESLSALLGPPVPHLSAGVRTLGPRIAPEIAERIDAAVDGVLSELRGQLAELHKDLPGGLETRRRFAADLAVDALSALARQVLVDAGSGPGDKQAQAAVNGLRRTVSRVMGADGGAAAGTGSDDGAGAGSGETGESGPERSAAAQETIDALTGRIRTAPTAAGLTLLIAEAIAVLLERLDTPVDIDDLDDALRSRWPEGEA